MNKRDFLRTSAGAGLGLLLGDTVWARFADLPVERLAEDEAFWGAIRAKYRLTPDYINLESGYYIMKLNHTGTHPVHTDLAIDSAIAFHEAIGIRRKEARLRYLQTYWTSKVRGIPNVILNTPSDPERTCAIANIGIKGVPPNDLAKTLLDRYKIWTTAVDSDSAAVHGVRVTPHVFILPRELDTLVKAVATIAKAA